MTGAIRLILVVVLAGGAAFLLTRHLASAKAGEMDEITWLTEEFALDSDQSRKIDALHAAYQPVCANHCAAIIAAQERVEIADTEIDRQTADTALRQLKQTCHQSTRAHLEAVAAVMAPEQGQRYLALISPRLSDHQHAEPFGLK